MYVLLPRLSRLLLVDPIRFDAVEDDAVDVPSLDFILVVDHGEGVLRK